MHLSTVAYGGNGRKSQVSNQTEEEWPNKWLIGGGWHYEELKSCNSPLLSQKISYSDYYGRYCGMQYDS